MSENIFTELYNRVLSLFGQSAPKEENAKDVACNRLRVVLMQDRTNLTPELLQRMRKELVELLSKYVEMDKEALDLSLEQDGDQVALMLSIPVIRAKDEDEIDAAMNSTEEEIEDEDENFEEDKANEEANVEDSSEEEEEEPKPKKRRSKKVTPPEEMNEEGEDHHEEQEVFENVEG